MGFYSAFMVAERVDVYSKSHLPDAPAHHWVSAGSAGQFEISEAEGVRRGTKIILQLKGDCYDFAKEDIISGN